MAGKSDKDKQKALQERHQAILNELLKEKCNSYCVDCDSKGPRWASWNLGVFLCIRCAGIHRNLGVHISRVKSVNLDSWTPEQIAVMQQMGNSVAKSVYEANLPTNFPAPQTDSALEALIRAKYEYKKYMDKNWTPPLHKVQSVVIEPVKKEKKHRNRSLPSRKPQTIVKSQSPETSPGIERKNKEKQKETRNTVELLNFDAPEIQMPTDAVAEDFLKLDGNHATANVVDCGGSMSSEFEALDLMGAISATPDQSRMANDAILALYGPSKSAVFPGVAGGVYVPQQAPVFYGGFSFNGQGPSSGSNAVPVQMPNVSGAAKSVTTSGTSSFSNSTWAQPSSVGRTLCTSLWQ